MFASLELDFERHVNEIDFCEKQHSVFEIDFDLQRTMSDTDFDLQGNLSDIDLDFGRNQAVVA